MGAGWERPNQGNDAWISRESRSVSRLEFSSTSAVLAGDIKDHVAGLGQ